jgi:hypothetical protein
MFGDFGLLATTRAKPSSEVSSKVLLQRGRERETYEITIHLPVSEEEGKKEKYTCVELAGYHWHDGGTDGLRYWLIQQREGMTPTTAQGRRAARGLGWLAADTQVQEGDAR